MSSVLQSEVQIGFLLDTVEDSHVEKSTSCNPAKLQPVPPNVSKRLPPARQMAYDECTIRLMFIEMDVNSNGTVTKEEFINYLRSRPQLQNIMYGGLTAAAQDEVARDNISPQLVRAMGYKRIIKVYKDIDVNKNGVLCWEEFIDFFRRTGLVVTYMTPDNPRERMAAALSNEYQRRQVVAKWQRGGAALGVGKQAELDLLAEESHSKFLFDQMQAEFNTQWAAEKVAKLKEQSARGRDAFSIVVDTVDTFKEVPKVFGRPGRGYTAVQQNVVPQASSTVDMETQCATDSQRTSPTVPSGPIQLPPIMLPCTDGLPNQGKSPMRRKGRSYSNRSPKICQQNSPKRSRSTRHSKSGLSVSPTKRGQTTQ